MPPPFYAHDPFLAVHAALQQPWLDLPAAVLSTACEGWALALLGLAVFAWFERDGRRLAAMYLPLTVALAASGAAVQQLKELFATPRPLAVYGPGQVRVALEPLYQFGFPSGHSSAVAAFGAYALLAYGRRLRWVLAFVLLGGLSRVYVGAHWITDVVGGWALGWSIGWAVHVTARRIRDTVLHLAPHPAPPGEPRGP
jgi:membrane-associated phospholipid phosphatase